MENLTVVWFLLAGLLLFATAVAERSFWRRCIYILGGLAMMFVAGEELSWGQRIFGFATPELLLGRNAQGEANVHNISTDTFTIAYIEGALLLFAAACAAFFCRKEKLFGIPFPSIPLALCFLIIAHYPPFISLDLWRIDKHGEIAALLVLLSFALLFGRPRLTVAAVSTATLLFVFQYVNIQSQEVLAIDLVYRIFYEINEYILGVACFFYAGELLVAQGRRAALPLTDISGATAPTSPRSTAPAPSENGGDESEGWNAAFFRSPWFITCLVIIAGSVCLVPLFHSWPRSNILITDDTYEDTYHGILEGSFVNLIIRSYFDVYLTENRIIYFKKECVQTDAETYFFLHLIADDPDDLPKSRRQYGFDNLDFLLTRRGKRFDEGGCVAIVNLPGYDITKIRTGQFNDEGRLWELEFSPP